MCWKGDTTIYTQTTFVSCPTLGREDIEYLFFTCPFAASCWSKLNIHWQIQLSIEERLHQAKQNFQKLWFMEVRHPPCLLSLLLCFTINKISYNCEDLPQSLLFKRKKKHLT
ncbi:hypothetical protein BS78_02G145800 [Paspalum vaginatum]|nr:hypothetical protein BS78_02G145800 [Paspalum vaginatum]